MTKGESNGGNPATGKAKALRGPVQHRPHPREAGAQQALGTESTPKPNRCCSKAIRGCWRGKTVIAAKMARVERHALHGPGGSPTRLLRRPGAPGGEPKPSGGDALRWRLGERSKPAAVSW